MTDLAETLESLCDDFFKSGQSNDVLNEIRAHLSRVIAQGLQIPITSGLIKHIPSLSSIMGGVLTPLLQSAIPDLTPMHYVPALNISRRYTPTPPSPRPLAPSTPLAPPLPRLPKTARPTPTSLPRTDPQKSEDDILPALFVSSNTQFFIGDPPQLPGRKHMLIPKSAKPPFTVFTTAGVVSVTQSSASFTPLAQYVLDRQNAYLISAAPISRRVALRCFMRWRERLRARLFTKKVTFYERANAADTPSLATLADEAREETMEVSQFSVVTSTFDTSKAPADFADLKAEAAESLSKASEKITEVRDSLGRRLAEALRAVKAAEVLARLGFDELLAVGALPPSLVPFAADAGRRVPSLARLKMRDKLLAHERKLAQKRVSKAEHASTKVRLAHRGALSMAWRVTSTEFAARFGKKSDSSGTRPLRIVARLAEDGLPIRLDPSLEGLSSWIASTITDLARVLLGGAAEAWKDTLIQAYPNYNLELDAPKDNPPGIDLKPAYTALQIELSNHIPTFGTTFEVAKAADEVSARDAAACSKCLTNLHASITATEALPRNLFAQAAPAFTLDLRHASEFALDRVVNAEKNLRERMSKEMDVIFTEVQTAWASGGDVGAVALEFVLLCAAISGGNPAPEVRASLDAVLRVLAQAGRKRAGPAGKAAESAAEAMGIMLPAANKDNDDDDEYEYEYEYEEDI